MTNAQARTGFAPHGLFRWLLIAAIAAGVAVLAFAQAAARREWPIAAFATLGPDFHASRPGVMALTRQLKDSPRSTGLALQQAGRRLLQSAPLSVTAFRAVGIGSAAVGNQVAATQAMRAAHRLSRRDAAVETWLIDAAVQRGDVPAVLDHYDALLRTVPDVSWPLLRHLTSALGVPSVRAALVSYAAAPWFADLILVAAKTAPDIAPAATLLLGIAELPDAPRLRAAYTMLLQRLVVANDLDLLAAVYRKLPGARMTDLSSPAIEPETAANYAPFRWRLASGTDQQAVLASDAQPGSLVIDASASVLTRGVVATRYMVLPRGPNRLAWQVGEPRQRGATTANWQLRCDGAAPALTTGNIADPRTPAFTDIPDGCRLLRLDLVLDAGDGAAPGRIRVGAIDVRAAAKRAPRDRSLSL